MIMKLDELIGVMQTITNNRDTIEIMQHVVAINILTAGLLAPSLKNKPRTDYDSCKESLSHLHLMSMEALADPEMHDIIKAYRNIFNRQEVGE